MVKRAKSASAAYYNETPLMSDEEFDTLIRAIRELDPGNPFLATVGAPISNNSPLGKVTHRYVMGSLDNSMTEEAFKKWYRKIPTGGIVLQHKLDGISIDLLYEGGKFRRASTRGDGEVGENVTHNFKLRSHIIPHTIPFTGVCHVRGEALLCVADWKEYFPNTANPRNAIAGIVRRTNGNGAEFITFRAFDTICEEADTTCVTEKDKINLLNRWGFVTVETVVADSLAGARAYYDHTLHFREDLPHEIDGVVVKVNNIEEGRAMGSHDKRPRWATAWKFPPRGSETVLEDVEFSIGHTGTITPVGKVKAVQVGGTTIRSVSLCNFDEIERLGISVGDTVRVVRAGDVIPKITEVLKKGQHGVAIRPPKVCPSCSGRVAREEGLALYKCVSEGCPGRQREIFANWIKKRDIKFFGPEYQHQFMHTYDTTGYEAIVDMYALTEKDYMSVSRTHSAMWQKIYNNVKESRKCKLKDFIGSLGIDLLGRSQTQTLIEQGITTVKDFVNLEPKRLLALSGFQSTKASRIVNSIREISEFITRLAELIEIISEEKEMSHTKGPLLGASFCFTGKATLPREELHKLVTNNAGVAEDRVTKDLTYLVLADINSTSSKACKARKFGTKLITEEQFMGMVGK